MRQVVQSFADGQVSVIEAPVPVAKSGQIVVRNAVSLVSIGTERMLLEFGRSGWVGKARSQPEKVKQVLEKARTDGWAATFEAVQSKMNQPTPLGYSSAGTVVAIGEGVTDLCVGDRVVSNGPHAEFVAVPRNLCAKIPDGVDFEDAAFTVVAAVGLQGIRLAAPTLGETFAVVGLGLIGLLTVQMLKAQGVRVIGVDFAGSRLDLAKSWGVDTLALDQTEDAVAALLHATGGRGIDGALITAATKDKGPLELAAKASRTRGRLVLVGTARLEFDRSDFYAKELSFQVSCSYGPGRYDESYEVRGVDYPLGLVRWTAGRNFEAVLEMMRTGALRTAPLVNHRFDFASAFDAYADETLKSSLGILLRYEADADLTRRRVSFPVGEVNTFATGVGLMGAGQYAGHVLVKSLKASGLRLKAVASPSGLSAALLARTHGFEEALSESQALLQDPDIGVVAISTRHDIHAPLAIRALEAGRHVYLEKPLAVTRAQAEAVRETLAAHPGLRLTVGFNRRFAPLVQKMQSLLAGLGAAPKNIVITVNAGALPADHWLRDRRTGGGRLIGEGCHFVDLARHLAGSSIVRGDVLAMGDSGRSGTPDSFQILLGFADGSTASIAYLANGSKAFPKERVEVYAAGRVLQLDNFKRLRGFGFKGFASAGGWSQDKGHVGAMKAFVASLEKGAAPSIPYDELFEVAEWTFALTERMESAVVTAGASTNVRHQSSIESADSNV